MEKRRKVQMLRQARPPRFKVRQARRLRAVATRPNGKDSIIVPRGRVANSAGMVDRAGTAAGVLVVVPAGAGAAREGAMEDAEAAIVHVLLAESCRNREICFASTVRRADE